MGIVDKFRQGRVWDGIQDIIGPPVMIVLLSLVYGAVLMVLWNWIMPTWLGLPRVAFLHSCGLVVMAHLLVKANPLQEGPFGYAAIPILKRVIRSAIDESKVGRSPEESARKDERGD